MAEQFDDVMIELETLGNERLRKRYLGQGAKEPLFGVATGAMKAIMKKTGKNQELANQLYETGNYDAMYFAGMIAEPEKMTEENFNHWMKQAYFYMISDYIVAVTLAESPFAQELADKWISSEKELYQSAGWSCYEWLLGNKADNEFDQNKILSMLKKVTKEIHTVTDHVKESMNNFVIAVGVSYLPLHEETKEVAKELGVVNVTEGKTTKVIPSALEAIQTMEEKGKIGFKRKNVRC